MVRPKSEFPPLPVEFRMLSTRRRCPRGSRRDYVPSIHARRAIGQLERLAPYGFRDNGKGASFHLRPGVGVLVPWVLVGKKGHSGASGPGTHLGIQFLDYNPAGALVSTRAVWRLRYCLFR